MGGSLHGQPEAIFMELRSQSREAAGALVRGRSEDSTSPVELKPPKALSP